MARVLVVLGVLLAVVTIIAGYLRWQAFDNETFRGTATELIANDAIRAEIAATSVDALFTNVDVAAELENRLPPDQQQLAGPISAGLRELTDRVANRLLERPRVQAVWRESVGLAHQELVDVLRNETTVVRVEDKAVVLNLRPLVLRVGERLAFVGNLSERLPPQTGVITIMDAEQLDTAQDLTKLFEAVATWIWVLPFLLWGIALWLARGRRRIELRAIALGLVVAGVLVLVVRSIAGSYVVAELTTTSSVEEAASEAWEIVTSLLADGAWAAIAIGLVALLGVWLAGDGRSGSASRRWLAPVFARPGLTYGILALLLLLFVWWEPFVHARRPLYVVVTAILLVLGVEALRRATVREFPDAAETEPREMLRPLGAPAPQHEGAVDSGARRQRGRRARAARGAAREGRPERRGARGGQGRASSAPSGLADGSRRRLVERERPALDLAGSLVRRDRDARGRGLHVAEPKPRGDRAVAEEPLAPTDDDRKRPDDERVDEVVAEQRLDQVGAADHEDVAAVRGFQCRDGLGDVALEQRRVSPGSSSSVREATCLRAELSLAASGSSSPTFGQCPPRISYDRRPNRISSAAR